MSRGGCKGEHEGKTRRRGSPHCRTVHMPCPAPVPLHDTRACCQPSQDGATCVCTVSFADSCACIFARPTVARGTYGRPCLPILTRTSTHGGSTGRERCGGGAADRRACQHKLPPLQATDNCSIPTLGSVAWDAGGTKPLAAAFVTNSAVPAARAKLCIYGIALNERRHVEGFMAAAKVRTVLAWPCMMDGPPCRGCCQELLPPLQRIASMSSR